MKFHDRGATTEVWVPGLWSHRGAGSTIVIDGHVDGHPRMWNMNEIPFLCNKTEFRGTWNIHNHGATTEVHVPQSQLMGRRMDALEHGT